MATVKIPKQLYIVSKNVIDREWSTPDYKTCTETAHNFGFLHPHEPTLKPDAKRKQTQHDWAYSGEQYLRDGVWCVKGSDREWRHGDNQWKVTYYDKPIEPEYAPRIWVNEPLTGFKIIDTVNRYRGNKLFKVLDPRGLEFEITVASLFEIIQIGTIENGIIKSACVWKANKNLVVVE
jgi:hypothetical protein